MRVTSLENVGLDEVVYTGRKRKESERIGEMKKLEKRLERRLKAKVENTICCLL